MSELKRMIEISPNIYGRREEKYEYNGFTCMSCGGTGWVDVDPLHSPERVACSLCKGSGKMKAVVSVQWVGDENKFK